MTLLDTLFSRMVDWVRPSFPDLGTALLGVAAILMARAGPSSDFSDIDVRW